eukprot:GILK01001002.1.p1 GENE.GILK01001002.1~~GILK01001002.1.p1  ORF type:complete len:461 (-),score=86.33 GILK01001002.1:345-1676(-)
MENNLNSDNILTTILQKEQDLLTLVSERGGLEAVDAAQAWPEIAAKLDFHPDTVREAYLKKLHEKEMPSDTLMSNADAEPEEAEQQQQEENEDTQDEDEEEESEDEQIGEKTGLYIVEEIRDRKLKYIRGKKTWFYLIKWEGYPEEQNTWERESNLHCKDMLKDFLAKEQSNAGKGKMEQGKRRTKTTPRKTATPKTAEKETRSTKKKAAEAEATPLKRKTRSATVEEPSEKKERKAPAARAAAARNSLPPATPSPLAAAKKAAKRSRDTPKSDAKNETDGTSKKARTGPLRSEYDGAKTISANLNQNYTHLDPTLIGSFDNGDTAVSVNGAKTDDDHLYLLVKWHKRADNFQPNNTWVLHKVCHKRCPQAVIDFYESRLKFDSSKKSAPASGSAPAVPPTAAPTGTPLATTTSDAAAGSSTLNGTGPASAEKPASAAVPASA